MTIVTAFIGSGVGSAIVTHWLTIKRAREEFFRAKLEELFLAVSGYCMQAGRVYDSHLAAISGKASYEEAIESSVQGIDLSARYFEKSQMLINLYFPELRELLDKLVAEIDKAARLRLALRGVVSAKAAKEFSDAIIRFDETGKLLREKISGSYAKLLRPRSLVEKLKKRMR